jgi:hypothetical protein
MRTNRVQRRLNKGNDVGKPPSNIGPSAMRFCGHKYIDHGLIYITWVYTHFNSADVQTSHGQL